MLVMDMPEIPPQYTSVIVAQASQVRQQGTERTIGICHPIENQEESRLSAVNSVSPLGAAYTYLKNVEHRKIDDAAYFAAKMTLLQAPKHSELLFDEENQVGRYFSSDYSFEGPDSATVLVEVGDYKAKVVYHFVLMQNVPGSGEEGEATDDKSICPNGYMWKISTTPDPAGKPTVSSVEHLAPVTSDAGATLDTALATLSASVLGFAGETAGVNLTFADLPGAAVGQATGSTITLDTNAAGNGWYIDATPWDNSEYLPTSNPYEWVRRRAVTSTARWICSAYCCTNTAMPSASTTAPTTTTTWLLR